jgi:hypothetical protein
LVTVVDSVTRWLVHVAPPDTDRDQYTREAVAMLVGYLES